MNTLLRYFTLIFVLSAPTLAFADDPAGKLLLTQGEVSIVLATPAGKIVQAKRGSALRSGDRVMTGAGAKAKILLADNAIFDLSENSEFMVNPASELKLLQGRIRALVGKQKPGKIIKIRNQTSVMGVRGTEMAMDTSEMLCLVGTCEVSSDKMPTPLVLSSGEKIMTEAMKPMVVQKIIEGEAARKYPPIQTTPIKSDHDNDLASVKSGEEGAAEESKFNKKLKDFDSKLSKIKSQILQKDGVDKITREELAEFLERNVEYLELFSLNELWKRHFFYHSLYHPDEEQYTPPAYVIQDGIGERYIIAVDQVQITPVE
jgi:hypothetical protein